MTQRTGRLEPRRKGQEHLAVGGDHVGLAGEVRIADQEGEAVVARDRVVDVGERLITPLYAEGEPGWTTSEASEVARDVGIEHAERGLGIADIVANDELA